MKQTWRWFGPADTISIEQLLQCGVEGVVSALHHIKPGDVWSIDEIQKRQAEIATLESGAPSGIIWDVVESVPVSEAIKTRTADYQTHIENYIQTLQNLAACGIKIVCYNFMPVLDWTRTELRSKRPHGGHAMRFDLIDFASFDLYILNRQGAEKDYPIEVLAKAKQRSFDWTNDDKKALEHNIVAGLPGANDNWTLEDIKALLASYDDIDAAQLRENLITFLKAVIPTCEELGINLCCHPDDPPFSLLGLPRIMSTIDDYAQIMRAVDHACNGITFCTGSLGVLARNDLVGMIKQWGHRIHFVHLRNTKRDGEIHGDLCSFHEDEHLAGDTDMVAVMSALLNEENKRRAAGRGDWQIPMRPDHGQEILSDLNVNSMPGYPLIGRMRGLAELRGIMTALDHDSVTRD